MPDRETTLALTAAQQTLLEKIHQVLAADPQIAAAWLGGSLGAGGGDAFSDVDRVVLTAAGAASQTGQRYGRGVDAIAAPALVNALFGGRVINVVTADWERFDLSFVEPDELGRFDPARLTLLFNRGEHDPARRPTAAYAPTPQTVLALVNEFLRVLGLTVVGLGREEYLVCLTGLEILRRLTIDLMLEENGVAPADRGGALNRNPFLTLDQRRALEALPPAAANRADILANDAAIAAIFLPRARALAARTGAVWPQAFEDATRRHLRVRLGLEIEAA